MDIWPNSQNSLNPSVFKFPNNVMIKQNNYMFHQICVKKNCLSMLLQFYLINQTDPYDVEGGLGVTHPF